jgi:hypothetical protein
VRAQESGNLDNLIAIEWDILRDLRKMLNDIELSKEHQKTRDHHSARGEFRNKHAR